MVHRSPLPLACSVTFTILHCALACLLCRSCWADAGTPAVADTQSIENTSFFRESSLVGSTPSTREGDTIGYTLTIRYNGDESPMPIDIVFTIPQPAMLVSASPGAPPPDENRELRWKDSVEKGKELVYSVTLITQPGSAANRTLLCSAAIYWHGAHDGPNWQGGVHWVQTETAIHSRLQPQDRQGQGEQRVSWTKVTVLAYLVGGPVLIVAIPWLIRRREGKDQPLGEAASTPVAQRLFPSLLAFALVCLIGVAHLMAYTIFKDFQRLFAWQQTECTVLDRKITTHDMQARAGQTQSRSTSINDPMVAVRYRFAGSVKFSAGPLEATSLRSSREKAATRQLAPFETGKAYPCWIDPDDPSAFILIRGLSWGWYLLCAGPMILLWFVSRYLLRRISGGKDRDRSHD